MSKELKLWTPGSLSLMERLHGRVDQSVQTSFLWQEEKNKEKKHHRKEEVFFNYM